MLYGNYNLQICENVEDKGGYVGLKHMEQYSIRLKSYANVDTDAILKVDGKEVGVFRLQPNQEVTLQRGPDDSGRFTFIRANTKEAKDANLSQISSDNLGLVQATFIPAKKKIKTKSYRALDDTKIQCCDTSMLSFSANAGGTGLTGKSDQSFYEVGDIDRDTNNTVIISLRLIERAVRPLISHRGNAIPRPV